MPGEAAANNSFSGRAEAPVIQAQHIETVYLASAPTPQRPAWTLPARPAGLVGRDRERTGLLALLDPARGAAAPGVVCLTGPGGVGKTALALDTAYDVRARGWYPGPALYVDARAHRSDRIDGAEALLGALLRQLGLPGDQLDRHRAGLEGQLRGTLAAEPQGCLIVVDDLADADLLGSVIPADGRHRLLVTLRGSPGRDDVSEVRLPGLGPDAARLLLADLSGRAADDPLVAEVAGLCGELPHALRLAASRLAEPDDAVQNFLAILRQPEERPAELGLVPLYDASLALLDAADARMLHLLTLHPGTEVDTAAAAALAGCTVPEAGRRLRRLCASHLLEQSGTPDRVRCHDLLWQYARSRCTAVESPAEVTAAEHRLVQHYAAHAPDADDGWLEREWRTLVLVVAMAARLGRCDVVSALAAGLIDHLTGQARTVDALSVLGHAVTAAHQRGEHGREAALLTEMSRQYHGVQRAREAAVCAEAGHLVHIRMGVLSPDMDDALAEHAAAQGDAHAAVHHRDRAARGWRRRGHLARYAVSLYGLGCGWDDLGEPGRAARAYARSLAAAEAAGDVRAAARACHALAAGAAARDAHDEAADHLTRGLDLARRTDDVRTTVALLNRLARARLDARRTDDAVELLDTALRLTDAYRLRQLRTSVLDLEADLLKSLATAADRAAEACERDAETAVEEHVVRCEREWFGRPRGAGRTAQVGTSEREGDATTEGAAPDTSDDPSEPAWWEVGAASSDRPDHRAWVREAERSPAVVAKRDAAARLRRQTDGLLARAAKAEEERGRRRQEEGAEHVPEPPVLRPNHHLRSVFARTTALPGCALLWSMAWVVHDWFQDARRPVTALLYLGLTVAAVWAGRRVWQRSRGTHAGDVLALCVHRCHPAAGAALLAYAAALTGARLTVLGAAVLLAAQTAWDLWPVVRHRMRPPAGVGAVRPSS